MLPDALNLSSIKKPDLRIQNDNLGSFFINNNEKDDNLSKSYQTDDTLMYDVSVQFLQIKHSGLYFYNKFVMVFTLIINQTQHMVSTPPPNSIQQSPQNNKKRLNKQ